MSGMRAVSWLIKHFFANLVILYIVKLTMQFFNCYQRCVLSCFHLLVVTLQIQKQRRPSEREDRRPTETETHRPKSSVANPRGSGRPIRSTANNQQRENGRSRD